MRGDRRMSALSRFNLEARRENKTYAEAQKEETLRRMRPSKRTCK